jgi:hypothetical protein
MWRNIAHSSHVVACAIEALALFAIRAARRYHVKGKCRHFYAMQPAGKMEP